MRFVWMVVVAAVGCSGAESEAPDAAGPAPAPGSCEALPQRAEATIHREPAGVAPTPEATAAFTRKLTGLWKRRNYFQWIVDTSHGVDATTGMRDWMVWWTDVDVVREGGQLTFRHVEGGGPDNIMIPTTRLLAEASAGLLLTGDPALARLVEQYAKGVTATFLGMVWDENDPVRSIMARAVLPENDEVPLSGGRTKKIDYSAWRKPTEAWNTDTIRVANNPFWGDVWVKNLRSKDDVPHIYLAAAILPYVAACAADPDARAAAREADSYLRGFAEDILASGYWIRTKTETGEIIKPGAPSDIANFVTFDFLAPNAECPAKLATALLARDGAEGNACLGGFGGRIERAAAHTHYYTYAILKNFHLAALMHSHVDRQKAAAEQLLAGLVVRVDEDFDMQDPDLPTERARWEADLAVFLVQASGAGLPLTGREAALIQREYDAAIDAIDAWPYWDLWDPALPDGVYPLRPSANIHAEDMAYFFWHCWSPFRSAEGAEIVDCAIIRDPARWGE